MIKIRQAVSSYITSPHIDSDRFVRPDVHDAQTDQSGDKHGFSRLNLSYV